MRFACIAVLLSACTQTYIPGVRNTPIIEQKGEVQLSTHIGLTQGLGNVDGNFQVAWAPTSFLAVAANHLVVNHQEEGDMRYHRVTDIAFGYYRPGKLYFDVFMGYGQGRASESTNSLRGTDFFASGSYRRFTLQPTLALNQPDFTFAYTSRISLVDFIKYNSNSYLGQPLDPVVFIEPSITYRVRLAKSIYPNFQLGFNIPIGDRPFFEYQFMHLAVGFVWKPNELWKK